MAHPLGMSLKVIVKNSRPNQFKKIRDVETNSNGDAIMVKKHSYRNRISKQAE